MTEDWFWNCEPKKLLAMINAKNEIDKMKMKMQGIYITSVFAGVDIDEEQKKEVLGIDKPVNPALLQGFIR